jgi:hypothetical protein
MAGNPYCIVNKLVDVLGHFVVLVAFVGPNPGGHMKLSFAAALAISLAFASCAAKDAPMRVTVKVADGFSGVIHLTPCVASANNPAVVDERGNGSLSACPSGELEIIVLKQGRTLYVRPEEITVERAGDGIPVSISTSIP